MFSNLMSNLNLSLYPTIKNTKSISELHSSAITFPEKYNQSSSGNAKSLLSFADIKGYLHTGGYEFLQLRYYIYSHVMWLGVL